MESKQLFPGCSITVEITATGLESLWDTFFITYCGKPQPIPSYCRVGDIRMRGNPIPEGESIVPLVSTPAPSNACTIAGKSYFQLCVSLEENWTIDGFDCLSGVLKVAVKCIKHLFIFSGWSHLCFKKGRDEWLDILFKVLAFIRVSFGVWTPDDYDNYFDLQNRFNIFNHQDEV